jgi:predicted phage baseplate assembly protein
VSGDGCGCDPQAPQPPVTDNPPGQPRLARRAATHATALARMRAAFGTDPPSGRLRALARQTTEDPTVALLDVWAVVADTVAFYAERIASEGFLRTATERRSVRELARALGYELRPGVSAQVELAFTAETAPGAPASVLVPRGTPVQSIPGQGQQPQVFETSADLEVRGVWNDILLAASTAQRLPYGTSVVWLQGATTTVRPGDAVLVVGKERRDYGRRPPGRPRPPGTERDDEKWDFRVVTVVEPEPAGYPGWTRLRLDRRIGFRRRQQLVAVEDITVHTFAERAALFGWNAPDPNLLVTEAGHPDGAVQNADGTWRWDGFDAVSADDPDVLELDGDHPGVLPGADAWIVVDQPGVTETYRVEAAAPDGAAKFALSGRITRVRVDITERLHRFGRRRAVVHCGSTPLPAGREPLTTPVGGPSIEVAATDPPLPAGRLVLVQGTDAVTGAPATEVVTVLDCAPAAATMTLTLEPALARTYVPGSVRVRGNVVAATHGETVEQVLGSGDGRAEFARFRPRRPPLTHVRATTPSGARPELVVRVDEVAWDQVPALDQAGPHDRVYALRYEEDGGATIVLGDGAHGARPPTGAENIRATYRTGIGAPGGVGAGQVALLTRRPLGVREVTNPAPARDWAAPETLEEARVNAPMRVRTLDRAVSLADYEDFARGYAGVGPARADLLWDGRADLVALTLLGTGARQVSGDLVADLREALDAARDPATARRLVTGQVLWFGIRLELRHDPAYERAAVEAAVVAALEAGLGAPARSFAVPVTAAGALVTVKGVAGVVACTMPRLLRLPDPPSPDPALPPALPPDSAAADLLVALPARWDGDVLPAQLLALAAGGVQIGVMAP